MLMEIKLEHLKIQGKSQVIQLWDIDAAEIASIAQSQGQKGVRGLVSEIIRKRLPTHFYNYQPVDWWFSDHTHAAAG